VPTTTPKHFVKSGDTKFYWYPCEPECRAVDTARYEMWLGSNRECNNHFLKELSAHNCIESSCKRPAVVRIAVGLEKRTRLRKSAHHSMPLWHKFRPSVNLDEYDSLQGSSDPSNATGTTSSAIMWANLRQNNSSVRGCAQLEPQSHLVLAVSTAADILVHKDTCRTSCLHPS